MIVNEYNKNFQDLVKYLKKKDNHSRNSKQ